MAKQLTITPKIAAAIARSTDSSVDVETVAVFETSALNTLPINQRGGLFDQARTSETTLRQMADYLNTDQQFAPLHSMHDQGSTLPIGRVFSGEVVAGDNGVQELRALFYVPKNTGSDIIAKLDTSVIDEVSVGLKTSHINCSECGFDYIGTDATFENIWSRTCNNGHEIGVEGVHTILNGLDKFLELSLVSRGAAQKTKIMSRTKSLLGEDGYKKLAASGHQPEATILFASQTTPKKEPEMDIAKLVDDLTTAKASVQVKDGELIVVKASVDTLTASNVALTAKVTELTAKVDASKVPALEASLTKAEADLAVALSFIRTEADRLAVASGAQKDAADATVEVLKASIETARTKLGSALPVGGSSAGTGSGSGNGATSFPTASYKTR